jgi:hypothetical protein
MARPLPSQAQLKELFDYDPETGELRWKIPRGNRSPGSLAGTLDDKGYVFVRLFKKTYKAHRLIWVYVHGEDPSRLQIDHIDGVKSNNAITNLRLATPSQNIQNTHIRTDNYLRFKNVYEAKGKYKVGFQVAGKYKHFGTYATLEEAVIVADVIRHKLHKEFANNGDTV